MKTKEKSVGFLIGRSARMLVKEMNHHFLELGMNITHEQMVILMHLSANDGQIQQEIANCLDKDKVSITKLIDGLEKKNLIERKFSKTDRRIKQIHLTKLGKENVPKIRAMAYSVNQAALKDFTDQEKENLIKSLNKIFNNLQEKHNSNTK